MKVKISEYLYNKNYTFKVILVLIISLIVCLIGNIFHFYLFVINISDPIEYHFKILTINSILSGFSLTNLGILISVSGDQLIEKLKGTDILVKRNILISYSIIYGSFSIFISLIFVVNIDIKLNKVLLGYISNYFLILEMFTLFLSIVYFLLSVRKIIQLLSYIYIPKKTYTPEKYNRIKQQMEDSIKPADEDEELIEDGYDKDELI